MNINISQKDCQFYVDEEKRKVICVIPHTTELFLRYIDEFNLIIIKAGDKFWSELLMPHRFVGIATCSENDTFDPEFGMQLAYHKAKRKLNTSFFKRAQKYVDRIDNEYTNIVNSFNDFVERLATNDEEREKNIEEYLNKETENNE